MDKNNNPKEIAEQIYINCYCLKNYCKKKEYLSKEFLNVCDWTNVILKKAKKLKRYYD